MASHNKNTEIEHKEAKGLNISMNDMPIKTTTLTKPEVPIVEEDEIGGRLSRW